MGIFALGLSGAVASSLVTSDEVLAPIDGIGNTAWTGIAWNAINSSTFKVRVTGLFNTSGGTVKYRVRIGGIPSSGITPAGTEVLYFQTTGTELVNEITGDISNPANISYLQFSVQRVSGTTVSASISSLIVELLPSSGGNGIILHWFPTTLVSTTSEVLHKEWVFNFSKLTSSSINIGFAGRSHGDIFVPSMVHNVRIGGTWNTTDGTIACTYNGIGYTLDGVLGGIVSNIANPYGLQAVKATFQPGSSYGSKFAHASVLICEA